MKLKIFVMLVMALLMLNGCSVRETVRTLDAVEEAAEQKLEQAEEAVEHTVRDAVQPAQPHAENQTADQNERLPVEEVQKIALAHAGFTAEQVSHLRTEFEYDDRIPTYDVSFREGHWEYEFEIHAETGEILSWEKDD